MSIETRLFFGCDSDIHAKSRSSRSLFRNTYQLDGSARAFVSRRTFKMLKSLDSHQIVSRVPRVPIGGGSNLHRSRRNLKAELSARASETLLAERKSFSFPHRDYCRHPDWVRLCICTVSSTDLGQYRCAFRNPGNDVESCSNRQLVHTDVKSELLGFRCGCPSKRHDTDQLSRRRGSRKDHCHDERQ